MQETCATGRLGPAAPQGSLQRRSLRGPVPTGGPALPGGGLCHATLLSCQCTNAAARGIKLPEGLHTRACLSKRMGVRPESNAAAHRVILDGYRRATEKLWVGPCRKEDPGGWLRYQKRRWREAATARKRRRLEAAQQRERAPAGPQPAPRGDRPPLMMSPLVLSGMMTLCPEWTQTLHSRGAAPLLGHGLHPEVYCAQSDRTSGRDTYPWSFKTMQPIHYRT